MYIKVEYSTDNGLTWNTLPGTVLGYTNFYFNWNLPKVNSDACLIRISDVANPAFNDVSDATFSIEIAPTLAATAWPMRGQNLLHSGRSTSKAPSSGELKWKYSAGNKVSSSPAIGLDGTFYVGSADYSLHAVRPDGTLKWTYPTGGNVYSSPAIDTDGTVYAGSTDDYLYAVKPNGELKWRYKTNSDIYSSPAIGDGTIYVGSFDNYLYAINTDGTLRWKFQTGDGVFTSPAIGPDGTIYFGSYDKYLYAVNSDGTLKWKYQTLSFITYSSPAIGEDGTVYVGSYDNSLYAIDSNGTMKWKYQTGGAIESSPSIGSDGTIYVGSYDKYLYAINSDGSLKWKYLTGNKVISSPSIGSDGTVYCGSQDTYIYALKPEGVLKWKYQTGGTVDSSPAIGADGALYIGSGDKYLYAFVPETIPGSLTVTSPNGGEIWMPGTSQNITWSSEDILNVKIEYSADYGSTWNPIRGSIEASAGSFTWQLPNIYSVTCLIKISNSLNSAANDVSDAVFTIKGTPGLARSAWPMRGQNPLHTGRSTSVYSASDSVRWKFQAGNIIESSLLSKRMEPYMLVLPTDIFMLSIQMAA